VARTTKQDLTELGVTGLEHRAGRIYEEWLRQLRMPRQRQKVYAEMRDNDPVIGALLFAVDMLIRGVRWWVQPATSEATDIEVAEFVEGALDDMSTSWEATVSEVLSFLPQGFSYHETVYKIRNGPNRDPSRRSRFNDGALGWRKLPIRAQNTIERWSFDDDDGGVESAWQRDPNRASALIEIPIGRSLLFRTTHHKGNPEGRSILRNAFRPWYFKKRLEEIEAIGIERNLAGLPLAYVPGRIMSSSAAAEERQVFQAIQDILRNVRRDEQEGVIFPGDRDVNGNRLYELDLLSPGARRDDTNGTIGRYDQRIAMTALADFILLGHEKVGSFSLSSDKSALFASAIDAWLDEIGSVMNRHAIPRLLALNGMDVESLPTLSHAGVEHVDLGELGEYVSKLAGAGASLFPDDELENALRSKAGLPERAEGEDDDETPTPPVSEDTEMDEDQEL